MFTAFSRVPARGSVEALCFVEDGASQAALLRI
jgi:hypothetical protein